MPSLLLALAVFLSAPAGAQSAGPATPPAAELAAKGGPAAANSGSRGTPPGVELRRIYSTRCETAIKSYARQLDNLDRAERKAIEGATSSLQALDGAWSRGGKVRQIYADLSMAVQQHNGWTKAIHEIPAAFQLPESLVDEALAKKRWESIRLLMLPVAKDQNGLGWSHPDDDDQRWQNSPICRGYEFLTLLRWLQSPPPDATKFQRQWVAQEAGEAAVARALANAEQPRRFLHNDYQYTPLKRPDASGWPHRARWALERLSWPEAPQARADAFIQAVKTKDEFMLDLAELYFRDPKSTLIHDWLVCGARWHPFLSIFDPRPDGEGVSSLQRRQGRGDALVRQWLVSGDPALAAAVFRAQLAARLDDCFVPDAPWTGETPANDSDTNRIAVAAAAAPAPVTPETVAPADSLPPERAWREICRWAAGQWRGAGGTHDVAVAIQMPRDWRLAFGPAELAEECKKAGLNFVDVPTPSVPSAILSIDQIQAPQRAHAAGSFTVSLVTANSKVSPISRKIEVPGPWPYWFASQMGVSWNEWMVLIGCLVALTLVAGAWCWSRCRPHDEIRLEVLPGRWMLACLGLPISGIAIAVLAAVTVPVGETTTGSLASLTKVISASALLSSAVFLVLQWRLWRTRGGAHESWQRSLPLWCSLALLGFFSHFLFVWYFGPTPRAAHSPIGGTVQFIVAADGSVSGPARRLCQRTVTAVFDELNGGEHENVVITERGDSSVLSVWATVRLLLVRFFSFKWLANSGNGPPFGPNIQQAIDGRYRLVAVAWQDGGPGGTEQIAEGRIRPEEAARFREDYTRLFNSPVHTNRLGHPATPSALLNGPPQNASFTLILHHGDHGSLRFESTHPKPTEMMADDRAVGQSLAVWLPTPTRDPLQNRALDCARRWQWLAERATESWSLARGIGHPLENLLPGTTDARLDEGGLSPDSLLALQMNPADSRADTTTNEIADEIAKKAVGMFHQQRNQNSVTRLASSVHWPHWILLWMVQAVVLPVAWLQFLLGTRKRKTAIRRCAIMVGASVVSLFGYAWLWRFEPQVSSYHSAVWLGYSACCYSLVAGLMVAVILAVILVAIQNRASGRRKRNYLKPPGGDLFLSPETSWSAEILRWGLPLLGTVALATAAMIWWLQPIAENPAFALRLVLPDLPSASRLALALWISGASCLLLPRSLNKLQTSAEKPTHYATT